MNEILERFPVVGTVTIKSAENAVHNYTREHGRAPESVEQTLEWQRNRVNSLLAI